MSDEAPGWLTAWRAAQPAPAAAPAARRKRSTPKGEPARKPAVAAPQPAQPPKVPRGLVLAAGTFAHMDEPGGGTLVQEPKPWPFDNCARREPVHDHDHRPPRVVRVVGWRLCLRCDAPFFSEDTRALRLCPRCKGVGPKKPLGD